MMMTHPTLDWDIDFLYISYTYFSWLAPLSLSSYEKFNTNQRITYAKSIVSLK